MEEKNGTAQPGRPEWIGDPVSRRIGFALCCGGGFAAVLLFLLFVTALWDAILAVMAIVYGIAFGGILFLYTLLRQGWRKRKCRTMGESDVLRAMIGNDVIEAEGFATRYADRMMIRGFFYVTAGRLVFLPEKVWRKSQAGGSATKKKKAAAKRPAPLLFPRSALRKVEPGKGNFGHRTLTLSTESLRECLFLIEAPSRWVELLKG